jgi:plasmid stability protein
MSTTLTLKNIPDSIYTRLREAADAHHRSMNSEVIACLEKVLAPVRIGAAGRIERARQLRSGLAGRLFDPTEIAAAIEEGRA